MPAFPPGFRENLVATHYRNAWSGDDILLLPSHSHTSLDMPALNANNGFSIPQVGLFHKLLRGVTVGALLAAFYERLGSLLRLL